MTLLAAALVGLGIGFLGGLFGKGGSAVATPLLAAFGVPPALALAAPLPATIPSTLAASYAYSEQRLVSWRVVRWSLWLGVPATIVGAYATRWIDGSLLVKATDVVLIGLGIRFVLSRGGAESAKLPERTEPLLLAAVAIAVGLAAGLLANSGGFLLAPLYVAILRMPIKSSFASSLAVAAVLAIPGAVVHAALGHIDWVLVAVLASTSVPLSFLGARVALRMDAGRLERAYGGALVLLGAAFLAFG